MASEDCKTSAARRRDSLSNKIPSEWRLSTSWTSSTGSNVSHNVLAVPRESGILTKKELSITEDYDATALLERIASGVFSSYEVTLAFSKRAAIAHQVVSLSCRLCDVR